MGQITEELTTALPGVYVRSIKVAETEDEDVNKGFFDRIDRQLQDGFNALGFSQGGLFLRGYVQKCNNPPVHNLVTFGSPHAGVSDWPGCLNKTDANCSLARSIFLSGVYFSWVQNRVVQAQYFKNPKKIETYLSKNIFLPEINNEREKKDSTYKENLTSLKRFIMVRFSEDQMIVPPETANNNLLELKDQPIYQEVITICATQNWLKFCPIGLDRT
ncbi:Palmitoyl-protein thioesterase 1 [Nowakowskiella sp. JEL0407]|nr:Palmitoyl-protein thioesterase 1 [Nowakowskiella sp. JEL0407]